MAAPELGPAGDAIEVFADWLSRRGNGELLDFDELVQRHPHLAAELAELEATWKRLAAANDLSHGSPSLQEPEKSKAREDFSSELIAQLAAHSTGFGRYRVRGEVARGGMGVILRIWDEDLRRHLAMKVILGKAEPSAGRATPPIDASRVARFLEEAQVTGQLDHPGVVPVHELGLDPEGRLYFTMKLVKGRTLKDVFDLVAEGKEGWTQTRALGVLLKVCEAMAYAHSKRVIHRDLKPSNIMVGRYGEVFVMDWGLARVLDRDDNKDIRVRPQPAPLTADVQSARRERAAFDPDSPLITMDGDVVGTPAYMSPEQASGKVERMGLPSDVYAVGALLYHLLTRRMPYVPPDAAMNNYAILSRVQEGPPASVASLAPDAPAELVAICSKAMAREPASRYTDMSALAEDLRAYLEHRVVAAYETGALAELRKWVKRNKPLAAALGVAALAIVIGGAAFAAKAKEATNARDNLALKNIELISINSKVEAARSEAQANEQAALQARAKADEQARLATEKTNDVLSLSAIQELKELVERSDALWPALPEKLPDYERWLADARVLVEGSASHPGLRDHESKLAEIRLRALPLTPAQVEQDRQASPRRAEFEQGRAKLTWMHRMLGDEPWPSEAAVEATLAHESLPADAFSLNWLAWPLVDPDPAKIEYGNELRGLNLARRAVAVAEEAERPLIRDTLAWALFRCGRLEEALAEEQLAGDEAQGELKQQLAVPLKRMQEQVALWGQGEPRAQRVEEASQLSARVADLERDVGKRGTFEFEDAQERWWHAQLSQLVADLEAFKDPRTGLFSEGASAQYGWGIMKRAAFARRVEVDTLSGAEAQRRWSDAIDAIATSAKYGGLVLTPQLGLLPIGADPDSGLWEFWHVQSGDEPPRGTDGKLALSESMGLVLVLIPGGTFWMGAQPNDPAGRNYDPAAEYHEGPVHEETLSPYFLSKYEMTQSQWERFTSRNPSEFRADHFSLSWTRDGKGWNGLHPVEQVSLDDCEQTLARLGLSLPSEAQWEFACRAGTTTPWWCGDARESLQGVANIADVYAHTYGSSSSPMWESWLDDGATVHAAIGSYRANAFGLHDMYGNVSEWCLDDYLLYLPRQVRVSDPIRTGTGARTRVVRGGTFDFGAPFARSAARDNEPPETRGPSIGLRPARKLGTP